MRAAFHLLAMAAGCAAVSGCTAPAARAACVECALRYPEGSDPPPGAYAEFERRCAAGDSDSCSIVGVMYEQGRGAELDLEAAARYFGTSCRAENYRACVSLGRMMAAGTAARADTEGALTLFEMACDRGELTGCHELGRTLASLGELSQSARVLKRACKAGHGPACESLGVMAEHGRGVTRNAERAQALYRRACLRGHTKACTRL